MVNLPGQSQGPPAASGRPGRRLLFAEGLTEVREGVGKVAEGERYQGGGQENREGADALRTGHPTETS